MDILSADVISNFVPYSELLAAIVGTLFYYKYKGTYVKYFLYLLWYITITEFLAWYASEKDILGFINEKGVHYNYWFYNLLRIITFLTLFYIYLKSISNDRFKKWIKAFISIYILSLVINWSFVQSFIFEISELPKILGSIFLIITILFYFVELLKSEKIILFHRLLLFWISVGLLLFYSGTIPFTLKFNGYAIIPGVHNLFLIVYILAIIMYLTFTFGFIWSKKE